MGTIATGQRNKYFLKFSETPGAYYLVSSQAYTKRNTPLCWMNTVENSVIWLCVLLHMVLKHSFKNIDNMGLHWEYKSFSREKLSTISLEYRKIGRHSHIPFFTDNIEWNSVVWIR